LDCKRARQRSVHRGLEVVVYLRRSAGVTVLVFIDLSTGEEIDRTLEAAEWRRRTVEREKQPAEREKQALQQRVSAGEQRANVADERARTLEE